METTLEKEAKDFMKSKTGTVEVFAEKDDGTEEWLGKVEVHNKDELLGYIGNIIETFKSNSILTLRTFESDDEAFINLIDTAKYSKFSIRIERKGIKQEFNK